MDEKTLKEQAEKAVEYIKGLVKEGSVSRVALIRKGETLVNLPLSAGIIGTVVGAIAAPWAVLTTALVSFGFDCEIEITKTDGTIINLSETPIGAKLTEVKEAAKEMVTPKKKEEPETEPIEVDAEPVDEEATSEE